MVPQQTVVNVSYQWRKKMVEEVSLIDMLEGGCKVRIEFGSKKSTLEF